MTLPPVPSKYPPEFPPETLAPTPQPVAPPASRRAVAFVLITVLLDMVGFGLIIPVLPELIESVGNIGLDEAAVIGGWMFAVFAIAQFACGPLMGNLSDAFGRRPLLLLAVAGLMVDYLFSAWAPTLFWLFVGRIIAGVCGSSYVIANAFITDVTPPEDRARAFGLVGAAFGIGFVLGPAIGGLLGEFGPRVPFYVAAAISAVNLLFGWFVLPETLPVEKRRKFQWRRANPFVTFQIFRTYSGVLPLCGVLFVFFFASSVYPAIWPFWGMAKFDWSTRTVGLTLAAFGLIAAITQGLLAGPLVKRFGEHRVALFGLIAAIIAAIGYGAAPGLGVVIFFLVIHAPEGLVHPMLIALLSKAVPEDAQGELQGGIAAVMNIAMLAGTVFFSQMFHVFLQEDAIIVSASMGFYLAAGVLVITLMMFWAIERRRVPALADVTEDADAG